MLSHAELDEPFSVAPHRLRCKDGSWIWVEATGVRYRRSDGEVRVVGVARDITSRLQAESARQQMERQLRSSQRLESLGILAGGIAHDFNNYLTPVVGTADLLRAELPEDSPQQRRVDLIRKAARCATDLTAQMLAYAGGTGLRLAVVDVSGAILGMQQLLESVATQRARLVRSGQRSRSSWSPATRASGFRMRCSHAARRAFSTSPSTPTGCSLPFGTCSSPAEDRGLPPAQTG
jgi:C4-dicarboxylate-specific signal transduction histidine kinase